MVPFAVVRYEGLIASYLGETASRLRKLFEYVRTRACVLFFDEFDTLAKERGDLHETGEIKRVVNSLLLQIDSVPSYVVVITATNHPELLTSSVATLPDPPRTAAADPSRCGEVPRPDIAAAQSVIGHIGSYGRRETCGHFL